MTQQHRVIASIAILAGALVASSSAASLAASPEPGAASPAFICADETTDCAGPLTVGEHSTVGFERPFTFSVPDGWTNNLDRYRAYQLVSDQAPESEFIVWTRAAPQAQTPDCSPARESGYGTTTQDWLAFLASRPGLDVTQPTTTDLSGRTLTSVELTVKPTWTALCEGNTDPTVLLVTDTEDPPTRGKWLGTQGYLGFVEVGDETVVIWLDSSGGVPFEDMVALATPVIETIRFTDAAPSGSPAAP